MGKDRQIVVIMDAAGLFYLIDSCNGSPHVEFWTPARAVGSEFPAGLRILLLRDVTAKANEQVYIPSLSDRDFDQKMQMTRKIQVWINSLNAEVARLSAKFSKTFERAKSFEKAGKIAEAIALYEQCLANWHTGTAAYERLRIIYTKRKNYLDAIRVCKTYLDMERAKSRLGLKYGDTADSEKRFTSQIEKLLNLVNKELLSVQGLWKRFGDGGGDCSGKAHLTG